MKIFSWWLNKKYLSKQAIKNISLAIEHAEKQSSGEIRVFIEANCKDEAYERAKEVFVKNKMFETKERNGVLLYISFVNKRVAIYGDEGIHQKVGDDFWKTSIQNLMPYLKNKENEKGIVCCILDIGQKLKKYFPYDVKSDNNELSNDIIFQ